MIAAFKVVGRAFGLWWREWVPFSLLNLAWLALQIPIVTGPPATAAMYAVAQRAAQGETLSAREAWQALRKMFWPAWGWGLVNGVLAVVVVGNFAAYSATPGLGWAALRLAWGILATLWFGMNLLYWPFWLSQSDRRMRTTLRNALLLFLKAPGFGLTLLVICGALVLASFVITLPLAMALTSWLALIGAVAVEAALQRPELVEPAAPTEMEAL